MNSIYTSIFFQEPVRTFKAIITANGIIQPPKPSQAPATPISNTIPNKYDKGINIVQHIIILTKAGNSVLPAPVRTKNSVKPTASKN